MQITVHSTPDLALADGVPVRIWKGTTGKGTPVVALITRIGAAEGDDSSELAAELAEAPTRVVIAEDEVDDLRDDLGPDEPTPVDAADGAAHQDEHRAARHALDLLARVSQAMIACDGHPVDRADPYHRAVESIRAVFTGEPSVPSRTPPPSWLVKDFWILYRSAKALADACSGRGDGRPHPPLMALEAQIRRLAPAFETCEVERRMGAPDRLTPAERHALAALHRWLHSPTGDCDLIESAQPYHDQVEAEDRGASCARLEKEERREREGELGRRAADVVDAARQVFARTGVMTPLEVEPHGDCKGGPVDSPSPAMTGVIVRAILDDPRVSGDDADPDAAALFLARALQGAQMGWHARTAHPEHEWTLIKAGAAPSESGKLVPWLFGFEIATGYPDAATDPAGELVIDDEMREYRRRYLAYRAPEQLSPRDRAIIAAVDAEDDAQFPAALLNVQKGGDS